MSIHRHLLKDRKIISLLIGNLSEEEINLINSRHIISSFVLLILLGCSSNQQPFVEGVYYNLYFYYWKNANEAVFPVRKETLYRVKGSGGLLDQSSEYSVNSNYCTINLDLLNKKIVRSDSIIYNDSFIEPNLFNIVYSPDSTYYITYEPPGTEYNFSVYLRASNRKAVKMPAFYSDDTNFIAYCNDSL